MSRRIWRPVFLFFLPLVTHGLRRCVQVVVSDLNGRGARRSISSRLPSRILRSDVEVWYIGLFRRCLHVSQRALWSDSGEQRAQ